MLEKYRTPVYLLSAGFLAISLISAAPCGGFGNRLYSDTNAFRIGDVLTVLIVESTTAYNEAGTKTEKDSEFSASVSQGTGFLDFVPGLGFGAGADNKFEGNGKTTRAGSISGTISAVVVDVKENGNLVIEGKRLLEINSEKEMLIVSGEVRPLDISGNNSVYSTSLCNASITYHGTGAVHTGERPGFLSRLAGWFF